MLQIQIIEKLNKFLKNYLNLQFNPLKSVDNFTFLMEGSYEAVNYRRADAYQIKTIHWFDKFYLYIEVSFGSNYSHKFISLSIFQGEATDTRKNQLFRAEWDDFNKEDEKRPQPHWHITRDKANYENFYSLINSFDSKEKSSFELFEMSDLEIFDTKKIHFAMSSNWHNRGNYVHKLDDANRIVDWIEGLLEHIKYELTN
ncbi:hypothetical protein [Cognataquiflexum rubidum]|uniref:hypothetical protein n=1 Tax=Cognataquiflexum rubidum TaxID=2922273 RepID=UPI001F12CB1A|nr:hypothetical protein [Cognataquiflexum rubidum]MCH6234706.1 hypothetical protein [Cognataquiflexum rubidum]